MKKILLLIIISVFISINTQADIKVNDVFEIITKEVEIHKKSPVMFSHKKHNEEYNISCSDCHHNEIGEPLINLKIGDDVKRCVECHIKLNKDKNNRKDIMVLENAMHGNCISCHKKTNIKSGDPNGRKGPAPVSCTKCHIKE